MPGYLSNRLISFDPLAGLSEVESDLESLEEALIIIQGDVEDIQLNIGV
jgi:hypothetical protein